MFLRILLIQHDIQSFILCSMSVNCLKILLDKFMVLIISMSPGIIRQCLIILISICGITQENIHSLI